MLSIAMLLVVQAAPAMSVAAPTNTVSAAMAEATANRPRVSTRPTFIDGPRAEIPADARAIGEQGTTIISGIIGTDGHFRELTIDRSSRSERLDAAALAAAAGSRFNPALDADGQAIAVPVKMPFEFSNTSSEEGTVVGMASYRCDQFVRDTDWWARTWPDTQHEFMSFIKEIAVVSPTMHMSGDTAERFQAASKSANFDKRWATAVAQCRAKPDGLFVDALKPEGEMFKNMAKSMRRR